jgi:hypothetical protein
MCGTIDPRHTYDEYLVLLAKSGMTRGRGQCTLHTWSPRPGRCCWCGGQRLKGSSNMMRSTAHPSTRLGLHAATLGCQTECRERGLTGEELGLAAGFGIEVGNRLQSRRRLLGSVP